MSEEQQLLYRCYVRKFSRVEFRDRFVPNEIPMAGAK